ncbi:neutral zinc metallopeptidase [Microbispora sp. ATCC PTA-5024]|uniref:neutral zinc metallopeptidase n=1 Tax=Microbispora sp. ATCC PTA-5024 TaxID=316330 RepID=UPI0003DCCB5F|nr:neutral zinc metallopeptidase [Microbispora sp. ATCC PTA-5024]ETK37404.1 hypothetical protein MPTA5024_04320 [Microbispora sp. ATCC PTA-5024]
MGEAYQQDAQQQGVPYQQGSYQPGGPFQPREAYQPAGPQQHGVPYQQGGEQQGPGGYPRQPDPPAFRDPGPRPHAWPGGPDVAQPGPRNVPPPPNTPPAPNLPPPSVLPPPHALPQAGHPGAGGPAAPPYAPPYPPQWPGQSPGQPPGQPGYPRPPVPPGPYGPPGYAPAWRPPKRRSGAGALIGGLVGAIAVVFVLLAVAGALLRSAHRSEPVSPVAIPTYGETTLPTYEPTSAPTSGTTRRPTSPPTAAPTKPPTPRVLNRSLKNNTVYRAGGLPRTNCPAGGASIYNHTQFKALILKTGTCMGKAWAPALRKVGIAWTPPSYMIARTRGRGACGDYPAPGSNVPYYCPSNRTIYASTSAMTREYGSLGSWNGIIISMMAHEYGHHIQNLSGISDSWWERTLDAHSQSERMGLSRRHELQATCFGGMFMRSVAASYPITTAQRNTLLWAYTHLGDPPGGPRDHGTTRSNAAWFRQGYTRPLAYQCNTWAVGAASVS